MGPVGGVDVDRDRPDLGGGVLEPHPLRAVRAPYAHPVTDLEPEAKQPHGEQVDRLVEGPVGLADSLMDRHEGVAVGEPCNHRFEVLADGLPQQGGRIFAS